MDLKSTIIPIKALLLEAVAGEQAVPCVGTGDSGPPSEPTGPWVVSKTWIRFREEAFLLFLWLIMVLLHPHPPCAALWCVFVCTVMCARAATPGQTQK